MDKTQISKERDKWRPRIAPCCSTPPVIIRSKWPGGPVLYAVECPYDEDTECVGQTEWYENAYHAMAAWDRGEWGWDGNATTAACPRPLPESALDNEGD